MEERNNLWIRICPRCLKQIEHKNRAKCRIAEKENKICISCSRSAIGSSNANFDTCPVCKIKIKVSRTLIGCEELEKHAMSHNMSTETLWLLKNSLKEKPFCQCGCGQHVPWRNWKTGYSNYVRGHNANVETNDAKKIRLEALRQSFSSGKSFGWSKGLTKETDERVKLRGEKTSQGRSQAFADGKLTIWSKGKTKLNDPRIKNYANKLAKKFADGELIPWAKGLTKETDPRIAKMISRVSLTHRSIKLRRHLDKFKRYSFEEIKNKVEIGGLLKLLRIEGDYINYLQPNIVVQCIKCNIIWNDSVKRLETTRCYKCDPAGSRAQSEIADWIKSQLPNIFTNIRSIIPPTELDIYVNGCSTAIEYNGLYWHSITHKSSSYHQAKSVKCLESNITLLHVFEDEWRDKKQIVKSMIAHRLGLTLRKINARACTIRLLTNEVRRNFFIDNHLDGDVQAHSAYGLFLKEELVAAISLRIPFHKKYSDYLEIARICCLRDTNVRGGISKLSKMACKIAKELDKKNLMTYVDFRFGSEKNTWTSSNWQFIKHTEPRWWWTDYHDRFNRFKYRADKKNGLSEEEVASKAKVVKIYGCSNMLFTMKCT
jgi:hypothetical protein